LRIWDLGLIPQINLGVCSIKEILVISH